MANYECATRTNYFHVKNADDFREFMKRVVSDWDKVDLWEEKDQSGNPIFGFGCYGSILGVRSQNTDDEDEELDYDAFVNELAKHVAIDDAAIILESGHEKLRYLTGTALVVTRNEQKYINVEHIAAAEAAKILCNPEWKTRTSY